MFFATGPIFHLVINNSLLYFHTVYTASSMRRIWMYDPFWSVLKSLDLIPQQEILYNDTICVIDNVIVLSDVVESSEYSSNTL